MLKFGIYFYPWYCAQKWAEFPTRCTPQIGRYLSSDIQAMQWQAERLAQLGVDYVVFEAVPPDDWSYPVISETLESLIPLINSKGLGHTFLFDAAVTNDIHFFSELIGEFLKKRFLNDNLPLLNGKKLIYVFSPNSSAAQMLSAKFPEFEIIYPVFLSAWNTSINELGKICDSMGIHDKFLKFFSYFEDRNENVLNALASLNYCQFWQYTEQTACINGLASVCPGYDDLLMQRKPQVAEKVHRRDGQTLVEQFAKAVDSGAEDILIYGWNEYFEATEIEPTLEHGDFYFELTRRLIAQVKNNEPIRMPEDTGKPEPGKIIYLSQELERSAQRYADKIPRWDQDDYLADIHFEGEPVIEGNCLFFKNVLVKNLGLKNWPIISENAPIRLGGQLLDASGAVIREGRAEFDADMPPGAEKNLSWTIEMSNLACGEYTVRLGVVWENKFWMPLHNPDICTLTVTLGHNHVFCN